MSNFYTLLCLQDNMNFHTFSKAGKSRNLVCAKISTNKVPYMPEKYNGPPLIHNTESKKPSACFCHIKINKENYHWLHNQ